MGCKCNCPDYRTHIRGVSIGGFPSSDKLMERRWNYDMPAFKRLCDDGITPARIDGAYVMERSATHAREIELGRPLDKDTHRAMDEAGM